MMRREKDYEGYRSVMQEKMKNDEMIWHCGRISHGECIAEGGSVQPNGMEAYIFLH